MLAACTRNRAVLYGLPWLAAWGAIVAGLAVTPSRAQSLAVWILFASVVLIGLPHGAADWWVLRRMASRWPATSGRRHGGGVAWLVTAYVLATLATLAFWKWRPAGALAAFLALSAWHFGSGDASVLLPGNTPWRDPVWWLFAAGRGLLVIFAPLTFWPVRSAQVLLPFAALDPGVGGLVAQLLRLAPGLLWAGAGLQTAGLCLEIRRRFTRCDRRTLAFEGLETGVLLLLFRVAPPLLGFACYWLAFHAWRHLLRLESTFSADTTERPLWRAVVDFHRRTLPLTLCSLAGLGLIFLLWPNLLHGSPGALTAYLILLSALTVPHALVIGGWEMQNTTGRVRE